LQPLFPCWQLYPRQPEAEQNLVRELGISPVLAQVLVNRGVVSADGARQFLWPPASLKEWGRGRYPLTAEKVKEAAQRILAAGRCGVKVLVYGDYDVDGVTATAIMLTALREAGIEADFYIPDRQGEGYGLNTEAVEWAAKEGYQLIVTVDCGISGTDEVKRANELGMRVVITDHHEPPPLLPAAEVIVDPKLERREAELSGAGVAFWVAQQVLGELGKAADEAVLLSCLDLAVIGTVADVVPLTGENRLLVKAGLKILQNSPRPGVRELIRASGLEGKELCPWHISFVIGPRLNAVGRMGSASLAVELLLTGSAERAAELAAKVEEFNRLRQMREKEVLAQALAMLEPEGVQEDFGGVIVLAGEGWHPGVIGVVASRLVERYCRPVLLISIEGETGRGSGRSVPSFDLYQALSGCADVFLEYGGHSQAEAARIEELKQRINEIAAKEMPSAAVQRCLWIDAEVKPEDISFSLLEELELLKPFGTGNPVPVLLLRGALAGECRVVGSDGQHLKLKIKHGSRELDAIAFNRPAVLGPVVDEKEEEEEGVSLLSVSQVTPLDVVFCLEENQWNGRTSLQLKVRDLRGTLLPSGWLQQLRAAADRGGLALAIHPLAIGIEEWWRHLYHRLKDLGLKAALVAGSMPQARNIAVWEKLEKGHFDLILTTEDCVAYYVEKFRCGPRPLDLWVQVRCGESEETELEEAKRFLQPAAVIEEADPMGLDGLSEQDRRSVWHRYRGRFPGREEISEVYRFLRAAAENKASFTVETAAFQSWWQGRRQELLADAGGVLSASLYIMQEIGLLEVSGAESLAQRPRAVNGTGAEAAVFQIYMHHQPGRRYDLNRSLWFREGKRVRRFLLGTPE